MLSEPPSPNGASAPTGEPLLKVRDLRTYLHTRWGVTKAVDGVSLDLWPGETLGIVGESGSGKTLLALSLIRLTPEPVSRNEGGQILLDGVDLLTLSTKQMRKVRGRDMSMILQDPHQSLNPVFRVGDQIQEALRQTGKVGSDQLRLQAIESLRLVRVPAPERRLSNYPHEMSGGMKQRVAGAIAMASRPRILIADEPTTALDETIQAQYLKLLRKVQEETGVAIILVTHDFGVVAESCDRVAVMYAGRIVEQGRVRDVFDRPSHPYTRALLASRPRLDTEIGELPSIEGQPPSLADLPPGCRFEPRCQQAMERCAVEYPPSFRVAEAQDASCWLLETGHTLESRT